MKKSEAYLEAAELVLIADRGCCRALEICGYPDAYGERKGSHFHAMFGPDAHDNRGSWWWDGYTPNEQHERCVLLCLAAAIAESEGD